MEYFEALSESRPIVDKVISLATTPIYKQAYEPHIKNYCSSFVKNTNKLITNLFVNSSIPLNDKNYIKCNEPVLLN